jgi:hypothetical protein
MARLRSSNRRRGDEKKVGTSVAVDRRQLKKRGAKAVKKSKKASKRDKKASGLVEAVVAVTMKNKTKRDNKSRQAKGKAQTLEEVAGASFKSWKRNQLECLLDNLDCEHNSLTKVFTLKKDMIKAIKELEHRWTGLSAKDLGDKCKTWFKYTTKTSKEEFLRYLLHKSYEGVLISELRTFKPSRLVKEEEDATTEEDTTDDERPTKGRKKASKRTEVKKRTIHSARKTIGKRNEDFVEDDGDEEEEEEKEEVGSPVGRRTRSRGQVKVEKQRSRGAAAAKKKIKKKKKSPAAVPLSPGGGRIKRERKAARGVKHYSDFALSEALGLKDYTGHFIREKLDGTWYDGFVVDRNTMNGNDYYDVQINCLMSEDRCLHDQRMTPAQVSECVVPFDKVVKRFFLRELRSGEVLFGRVTKYLGNLDAKNRKHVHSYRVSYTDGEYKDEVLTNYTLSGILLSGSDRQIERQIRRGSKKKKKPSVKRAGSAHPFRKHQRIDLEDQDTMFVTLFFFQHGKMNKQMLEVPLNATVAVLKHCIWQASEWMNGWHPDLQSLVKGQISLDKAKKSLADYGVGHDDLIGVDLEAREDPASDSDSEESRDEEADRWAGSVEHYKKRHGESSSPATVTREWRLVRYLSSPNRKNIRWSLEETVELIKLVRQFYEKKEYMHAKMWSRIHEVAGEKGNFKNYKPEQLRIKWRTLKHTASIAAEWRRGDNAKIPEDVLDQVRYVRDELEYDEDGERVNARRGSV